MTQLTLNFEEKKEVEVWKDIPGFEGMYQASTFGRIKGLARTSYFVDGRVYHFKEKLLKSSFNPYLDYLAVCLHNKNKEKYVNQIHRLVAITFLNYKPNKGVLTVNHIDGNKLNNRLSNLEIVTHRYNVSDGFLRKNTSSKYTGVHWRADEKAWYVRIWNNTYKKCLHAGIYRSEEKAGQIYQLALQNIDLYDGDIEKFKKLIRSLWM